ncbi:hypothetical protein FPCIR_4216 [Fusarium pseudocircinatum]|uniref:RanBP2-type domain-containing protein n=1 Tax=Fusarium pseudocircinatum TaxID=56676 RepID=A0A8H5PFU2_9HYPO|nr:hypothetical protein FPCIR_4216 [Fusarium pseudocircinatum]
MQPTPPSEPDDSSQDPLGDSVESISFTGTTTRIRVDHVEWICRFMSCGTVNNISVTDCKQCGTQREPQVDAINDEDRFIGSTDPENSSPPSETSGKAGAPGSSESGDAVETNRGAGTVTTDDGSEASHTERSFENGQRQNWDDDDLGDDEEDDDDDDDEEDEEDEEDQYYEELEDALRWAR